MKIYSCCVPCENGLKSEIDSEFTGSEKCPFCGSESKFLDSEKITKFIAGILKCLSPSQNGTITLPSFFCKSMRIFCNESPARVKYYLQNTEYDINAKYDYGEEIKQVLEDWNHFKNEVKTVRRFTIFERYLEEMGWDSLLTNKDLIYDIDSSIPLYRARIHDKVVNEAYKEEDMFPPSPNYWDGRAHPKGISCMYLSKEEETTLYETRTSKLDNITIAKFRLKNKKKIFDLASNIECFFNLNNCANDKDIQTLIKRTLLLNKISEELSTPIHWHDSPIEYIPTQIICEYICLLNNVDGIQYASSMRNKGTNIVLFDSKGIEMQEASLVCVKDLKIEYVKK